MTDHHQQNVDKFRALIAPWEMGYQSAVHSFVALKHGENIHLLFGRIFLEPTVAGADRNAFSFETEHIIAGRFVTSVNSQIIASILDKARMGQIDRNDGRSPILMEKDDSLSSSFSPVYHPFVSEGPRLPSLLIRGISKENLLNKVMREKDLDWELKAATSPYENLDELLQYCGLPTYGQMGSNATLEVVARSPAHIIDSSTITNGEAVIECRIAGQLDVEKLRLGYKVIWPDKTDRGSVIGTSFNWRDDNDIKVGTYRMAVDDAFLFRGFLSYDDISLHQRWVTDPQKHLNPRHAVHQIFDPDLEILKRLLFKPEVDKQDGFETAVSTLLNLLGFSAALYGRNPKLQKGPDIISVSPNGDVAVVECTIGLLDEKDKLAKLVQRSKLVREKLAEAGYAHLKLQPIIVTCLTRAEVQAHFDNAAKHGIAVVCKENLESMLERVRLPLDPHQLFQEAKELIPVSNQQALL